MWLVLNIMFFLTIDLRYAKTFFSTQTAAQYTCERFLTSTEDDMKWAAAFENRMEYKKSIKGEVKAWVAANIGKWRAEKPDFFKVEMIPDDYLPKEVLEAEGGARRRRSSVGLRASYGINMPNAGDGGGGKGGTNNKVRVHPQEDSDR